MHKIEINKKYLAIKIRRFFKIMFYAKLYLRIQIYGVYCLRYAPPKEAIRFCLKLKNEFPHYFNSITHELVTS
jgi:hypothetical protein